MAEGGAGVNGGEGRRGRELGDVDVRRRHGGRGFVDGWGVRRWRGGAVVQVPRLWHGAGGGVVIGSAGVVGAGQGLGCRYGGPSRDGEMVCRGWAKLNQFVELEEWLAFVPVAPPPVLPREGCLHRRGAGP